MDENTMNISTTESATGDAKDRGTPKMTKEEAQQKTDYELLQMIQQSQGHTAKDFSDYMNCDFSYSYLTGLLRERGYENGWHKTSEDPSSVTKPVVILMKKSEAGTIRKSFTIDKEVFAEWKVFNKDNPLPSVTLGCALRRFMDDYRTGSLILELEI